MVPPGPPTPIGGAQTVNPSALLRSSSSLLGSQGGSIPAQPAFPALVSQRSQYGNMNLVSNLSNVSSLLGGGGNAGIGVSQPFSGRIVPQPAVSNTGLSGSTSIQRGGIIMNAEPDPLSGVGNGLGFNATSLPFNTSNVSGVISPRVSGTLMGSGGAQLPNSNNQLPQEPHHSQQIDMQNFTHVQQGQDSSNNMQIQSPHMLTARGLQQFSTHSSVGLGVSQQQQLQLLRGLSGDQNGSHPFTSLCSLVPVKMEQQMAIDQCGPQQLQNLRTMCSMNMEPQQQQRMGSVKLEPQQQQQQQQLAMLRSIACIKSEAQHADQSLYLQQPQQQQQLLQMSRQSLQQMQLQAQMSLLQQQRLLQHQQQQQQQQMFKTLPLQRTQLHQQAIQRFQQHNLPSRSSVKPMIYEPGMCARRLTQYMYQQQHRPPDNNIEFWRNIVSEYFAPHAKKRWCVSLYGNGRQTTGVFPQDVWHCEICNIKPGRGFETTVEVLPRLCKIKYDSGTLEELLYVDMPHEYQTPSGHIVLDYGKAIQESVFEQLRVVRDGQLRIVFSVDLKICSWEFCARRHVELIPRRLILSQVSQLGTVAQKYQASTQNGSSNLSVQELQNNCNMFVATARNLAKAMEVPLVNDLGYTKRYVRCLQISEVVNSMKDLIDYSRETKTGPIASLINYPRRTTGSGGATQGQHQQQQQQEEQARFQNGDGSVQTSVLQVTQGNSAAGLTNSLNASPTSTFTTTSAIAGLAHQNSINIRPDNPLNNGSSPFGSSVQMSSAGSSSSLQQQSHPNPPSPFPTAAPAPAPPSSNTLPQSSIPPTVGHTSSANIPHQASHSGEVDPDDSQSSVQQIIQEIMMSSQPNAGGYMVGLSAVGNEMKSLNAINLQTGNTPLKGTSCVVGNGLSNETGINGVGFGSIGGINPISAAGLGCARPTMPGNSLPILNGRINMPSMPQQEPTLSRQQDMGSRMLCGIGSVSNFNDLQFDWKPSP